MEQSFELAKIEGIIKRRRWWLIVPFIIVAASVAIVAMLLPDIYKSSSTIMIQNASIPDKLVAPTVTSYADQRIKSIAQEVNSRAKILALVQKYDLLPQRRENLTKMHYFMKFQIFIMSTLLQNTRTKNKFKWRLKMRLSKQL